MPRSLLLAATMVGLSLNAGAATFAYVSSSGDGTISQYQLDERSGALSLVSKTVAGEQLSPLAISPDKHALFAAIRSTPYKVLSYSIDPATGQLSKSSEASLPASMAYLSTDRSGHFLMGASYGADLLSVQRINADYSVASEPIQVVKTGPHAHSIRTDISNRFVYAGNLGADHVLQYRLDDASGKLTAIGSGFVTTPANTGPRHLAFSPNGKFLYVVGEMAGTVIAYAIDPQSGALNEASHANSIPARLKLQHGLERNAANNELKDDPTPRIWAADIRISPDGTLLYTTERSTSTVSAFKVDPAHGTLTFLGNYPVKETQPRNIAFSPDGHWLLVTGEKSSVFGSYAINANNGGLTRVGEAPAGQNALWVEMLQL